MLSLKLTAIVPSAGGDKAHVQEQGAKVDCGLRIVCAPMISATDTRQHQKAVGVLHIYSAFILN